MTSLALTIRETLRYRGAIGQWSWVLHRVSGLGVVLFLILHVIDTSWSVFYPELYAEAIAIYQTPLFTIGEFILVACVVYHAFNGLRIALFDFRPDLWQHQQRAALGVLGLTALVLVPVFLAMFGHVLDHYSEDPFILPLDRVIMAQLPFIAGMVGTVIVAMVLSGIYGAVMKDDGESLQANNLERFWWSFMRLSGILIVPLVFGHLVMIHVVQGVFDLTASNFPVVGTLAENSTGSAVEFVQARWSYVAGGLYIWKIYDMLLLLLVVLHGFNGLRYVLTDYTAKNPILRRAMIYTCIIGAAVLIVVGGAALLGTIENDAVAMAQTSINKLKCEVDDEALPNCIAILGEEAEGGAADVDDELGDTEADEETGDAEEDDGGGGDAETGSEDDAESESEATEEAGD